MVADLIKSIKEAEIKAEKLQNEAEIKVAEMMNKVKKEADGIRSAKLKEEMKKATLRVNIAKSDANRIYKNAIKQAEDEIEDLRAIAKKNKGKAMQVILESIRK
ncbi:MAG: hypothetical protein IJ758_00700 [Clostridia bacterium]|nr:hypothetical protein [Clostridia bacterium]